MDAETWLTLCKWAVVVGGLVATLGGAGLWYFDARVARQRASSYIAAPVRVAAPPGEPVEPPASGGAAVVRAPAPTPPASSRAVVRALELRIAVEADQPEGLWSEAPSDGARNVVTLVLADRTRLRFVSDGAVAVERVGPDRRRLTFTYAPETPGEVLGRDVAALGAVEVMAVDYREAFRRVGFAAEDEPTLLTLTVLVNGAVAGRLDLRGAPGLLGGTQAILDVAEAFSALRERAGP